jgi:Na+/H+ antiporter NhaC
VLRKIGFISLAIGSLLLLIYFTALEIGIINNTATVSDQLTEGIFIGILILILIVVLILSLIEIFKKTKN